MSTTEDRLVIGEYGKNLVLRTGLSVANVYQFGSVSYLKPSGVEGVWPGSLVAGADGYWDVVYPLQLGDINEVGIWSFMSMVGNNQPPTKRLYGRPALLRVYETHERST